MPALSVRGTIADHGKPPVLPVPLRVGVTLSRDDTDVTYIYSLNVVGSTDGTFAAEFSISADVEAQFTVSGKPGSGRGLPAAGSPSRSTRIRRGWGIWSIRLRSWHCSAATRPSRASQVPWSTTSIWTSHFPD